MIDVFRKSEIPISKIIEIDVDCIEHFILLGVVDVPNKVKSVSIETEIFQMHCPLFRLRDKVAIDLGGDC